MEKKFLQEIAQLDQMEKDREEQIRLAKEERDR